MNKCVKKILIVMLLAVSALSLAGFAAKAHAITLSAKKVTEKKVNIKWKKEAKAAKYVIYRWSHKKRQSEKEKYKKIKTLKKSKVSFTDKKIKKKTYYDYRIEAISKKGKVLDTADIGIYTGIEKPSLKIPDYSADPESLDRRAIVVSPEYIVLNIEKRECYEGSLEPTGFELYRKDVSSGTKYKKIKTIKSKKSKNTYKFKDKTVKAGHEYSYKIRSYIKKKGKKYSAYSQKVTGKAINQYPKCSLELISPIDPSTGFIEIKMDSDKFNDGIVFKQYGSNPYDEEDSEEDMYYIISVQEKAIETDEDTGEDEEVLNDCYFSAQLYSSSKDGEKWTKCDDTCVLNPGESLLMRFKLTEESLDEYREYEFTDEEKYQMIEGEFNVDPYTTGDGDYIMKGDFNEGTVRFSEVTGW